MKTMKNTMKCLIAVFIMAMAFVVTGTTAQAAVNQTAQTQTSITVDWSTSAKEYATAYYVGYSEDMSAARTMAESKTITLAPTVTSYTITGLKPGTKYYVYVYATYSYSASGNQYTNSIGSSYDSVTLPAKVTGLNQTKWWYYIENVDFSWDEQTGADFEVKVMNHKGKVLKKTDVYGNKSGYDDVNNNKTYQVQVRAYVTINGQKVYGDWSDKAYLFTQPMVNKSKVSGGKLTIKWGKITGVSSYDVYVSTKEKSGYKKVAKNIKASKTSVTVKKLKGKKFKASKKYYVYIVAKKKVGKKTYTSGRHYTCTVKGSSRPSVNWTFD